MSEHANWMTSGQAAEAAGGGYEGAAELVRHGREGLLEARCRKLVAVRGGRESEALTDDSGWTSVPPEVWAVVMEGWCLPFVKMGFYDETGRIDAGDSRKGVRAFGIQFRADQVAEIFGSPEAPPQREIASLAGAAPTVGPQSKAPNAGGRPSDKHGEPIAKVTAGLIKAPIDQLRNETGDSLALTLSEAYRAAGTAPPTGKNLEGICWGILRTVKDIRKTEL